MKSITYITSITALLFCITVLFSCTKEESQEIFLWNQTQCAEPWETLLSDSNSKIRKAITMYLADEDIKVQNIQFKFDKDLEAHCQACTCTSGTKIFISAEEGNSIKMQELGFVRI